MSRNVYNCLCPLCLGGERKMKMFNFRCGMFEMPRNNIIKHLYNNHYEMYSLKYSHHSSFSVVDL